MSAPLSKGYHRKILTNSHFRKKICFIYDNKLYFNVLKAEVLWGTGYYDGLMSGIFLYKNILHYGKCWQSSGTRGTRYYWLYPLTPEEQIIRRKQFYFYLSRKYHHVHTLELRTYTPIYTKKIIEEMTLNTSENTPTIGYISSNILTNRQRINIEPEAILLKSENLPITTKFFNWIKNKIKGKFQ